MWASYQHAKPEKVENGGQAGWFTCYDSLASEDLQTQNVLASTILDGMLSGCQVCLSGDGHEAWRMWKRRIVHAAMGQLRLLIW